MIKKLTKDDKQETKGGWTWMQGDWCVLKCGLYCGEKGKITRIFKRR